METRIKNVWNLFVFSLRNISRYQSDFNTQSVRENPEPTTFLRNVSVISFEITFIFVHQNLFNNSRWHRFDLCDFIRFIRIFTKNILSSVNLCPQYEIVQTWTNTYHIDRFSTNWSHYPQNHIYRAFRSKTMG